MRNSLRTRITIYFVIMALVPLLLLGLDSTIRTFRAQQEQSLDLQSQVAQNVATGVQSFIANRTDELQILTEVNGFTYLSQDEQADLFTNLLAHEDLYDELILVDEQGQEQLRLSRYAFYGDEDLESRSGQDEFERPRETREFYFSSVKFNEDTGEPFITISLPLTDLRSGDFTGALIADFRFKPIWDLMAQADVPGSGIVYMLDSNDLLVAHRNPSLVLQGTAVTIPDENTFTTGLAGIDVALAFDEIQFGEEIFRIVAEIPASEALALANDSVRSTVFVLIGSLIAATAIGAIAADRISKPINTLASTAEAVAAGSLTQRVDIHSKDEIGTLATAFNSMTEQLRSLVGNLEQRVARRTRDLELANEIGRNVSEIRDANQLLSDAVKLIHDEFDLYLAQIYLVEEDQETLLLQAAEGHAADRLLDQAHFLAITAASINGMAVSEKRAIVVSDTSIHSRFRPNPLLPDTRCEMAIPLLLADKVIGVLDIQSTIPNALTEENIPAFMAMASQLATAFENASLFSENEKATANMEVALADTEQQAKRLISLNDMGTNLVAASTLEDVYQIVSSQILTIIKGDRASIALTAEAGDKAEVLALQGEKGAVPTGATIPFAGTAIGLAIRENRIVQLPKESPLSTYADSRQFAQQGFQTILIMPLNVGGKIIGTLNVGSTQSYAFTETDISFIQQIATLFATTIDSINLSERVQNLASIVESHPDFIGIGTLEGEAVYLNPAGLALAGLPSDYEVRGMLAADFYTEEDAERLIQEGIPAALSTGSWTSEGHLRQADGTIIPVEQTVAINFDADERANSFSITMRDISDRQEAVEAQRRLTTQLEERLLQVNTMQRVMTHEGWSAFLTATNRMVQGFKYDNEQVRMISKRDIETGEVPIITETEPDAQSDPTTAAAAVKIRGETIGIIGARSANGEPLDDEKLIMLNNLTEQVGEALDRARLFEEMELAREQMNALYLGSERVVQAQTVDDVLDALIGSTVLKQMDTVNIMHFDKPWDDIPPETLTTIALWQKQPDVTPEKIGDSFMLAQFPTLHKISPDKPTLFYDVMTDERSGADAKMLAEKLNVKSVFYFPLIVSGQWFGLVSAKAIEPIHFSEDNIKQITSLVDQTATVIQTQLLFEQSQDRARREQLLREVTAKVYAAPDTESILKTAVKEVNRIMGVDSFVYLDDLADSQNTTGNGHHLETAEDTTAQEG